MKRTINYPFLFVSAILLFFGFIFLATLSAPASIKAFENANYYLFHQLIALFIGLVLALIVIRIPMDFIKKTSLFLFIINILLTMAVFMPIIGTEFWGAKRWISIGSNTFQPSEFLKITAILFLCSLISDRLSENYKKERIFSIKRGYYNLTNLLLPFFLILSVIAIILYLQRDLSTLGIISISLVVIYFLSETPLWHTILTFAIGLAGAILFIAIEPYRIQRLLTLLRPESDPLGRGFQIKQSLIAMGSGGVLGEGLGLSTQKFGFLPQAMSDSVFAILGEELGMVGSTIVVLLFLLFLYFGFKIAVSAKDRFSRLVAVGITSWIVFQAFINIASTIGVFPLSGIPLPFFSYGGTHLITEIVGIALLLKISRN
jgi:cell division protein FtsW